MTHCTPPPTYLVLSSEMVIGTAWRSIGWWDPRRAWLASVVRQRPQAEILGDLTSRFETTREAADALYGQAARLDTPRDVEEFVTPSLAYLPPGWSSCSDPAQGPWMCRIDMPIDQGRAVLTAVEYHPGAPAETRLRTSRGDRAPAALLIAGAERLREMAVNGTGDERIGVLVDVLNHRVLLGAPDLLRSTFTRLVFLDGRFTQRFELVDDRTGYANQRVRTWRLR